MGLEGFGGVVLTHTVLLLLPVPVREACASGASVCVFVGLCTHETIEVMHECIPF